MKVLVMKVSGPFSDALKIDRHADTVIDIRLHLFFC